MAKNTGLAKEALLAALLAWPDNPAQVAQFVTLVSQQPVSLLEALLEDAETAARIPVEATQAMLRKLAQEDAPWTSDYVAVMPASAWRAELVGTMLARWGGDDLPAALGWARQLSDRSLQQSALVHLSYHWFEVDPKEALTFAALQAADHPQLLTTLVSQWSAQNPRAAAGWSAEMADEPGMASVAASAVAAWAGKDELAAAEFVLRLPEGELRNEAAVSVIAALTEKSPESGAAWVKSFPSGATKDYAIENLLYRWAVADPHSALTWANRLPANERDKAIYAGAGGLVENQPALAATWTMAIQNEGLRVQQTERVARRWLETDRWAAENWIRQSVLPLETKNRLVGLFPSNF